MVAALSSGSLVPSEDGFSLVLEQGVQVKVTAQELQVLDHWFSLCDIDGDQVVTGLEGPAFLRSSGLDATVLTEIWRLASGGPPNGVGNSVGISNGDNTCESTRLSRGQFFVALALVALAQRNGGNLPKPSAFRIGEATERIVLPDFMLGLGVGAITQVDDGLVSASILHHYHVDGASATSSGHTVYCIATDSTLPKFAKRHSQVIRRYSDFEWLASRFAHAGAAILPQLPVKSMWRSSRPDFVRDRARRLNGYLKRVTKHPLLKSSYELQVFLEATPAGLRAAKALLPATHVRAFSPLDFSLSRDASVPGSVAIVSGSAWPNKIVQMVDPKPSPISANTGTSNGHFGNGTHAHAGSSPSPSSSTRSSSSTNGFHVHGDATKGLLGGAKGLIGGSAAGLWGSVRGVAGYASGAIVKGAGVVSGKKGWGNWTGRLDSSLSPIKSVAKAKLQADVEEQLEKSAAYAPTLVGAVKSLTKLLESQREYAGVCSVLGQALIQWCTIDANALAEFESADRRRNPLALDVPSTQATTGTLAKAFSNSPAEPSANGNGYTKIYNNAKTIYNNVKSNGRSDDKSTASNGHNGYNEWGDVTLRRNSSAGEDVDSSAVTPAPLEATGLRLERFAAEVEEEAFQEESELLDMLSDHCGCLVSAREQADRHRTACIELQQCEDRLAAAEEAAAGVLRSQTDDGEALEEATKAVAAAKVELEASKKSLDWLSNLLASEVVRINKERRREIQQGLIDCARLRAHAARSAAKSWLALKAQIEDWPEGDEVASPDCVIADSWTHAAANSVTTDWNGGSEVASQSSVFLGQTRNTDEKKR